MGNVLINESNLSAIASAIRTKNGQSTTYKPREMAPAILAISGGTGDGVVWQDAEGYIHLSEDEAGTIILTSLSATANGTYSASYPNAYSTVTVNVGPSRSAANLTASGSTVTVPSGYYSSQVTKNVASTTLATPAMAFTASTGAIKATVTQTAGYVAAGTTSSTYTLTPKTSANITVSGSTITTGSGYYSSAIAKNVAAGSAFPPAVTITKAPTITVNASGVVTATYTGSSSITPTVTSGYVTAGTAGTISTTGTSTYQLTSKAAATYYPSTADQTVASQRWLVGNQTIKSVTTSNLTAANIAEGVVVKVGDSANASRITQITGTHSGAEKHKATITSSGSDSLAYVTYNGTKYYTLNNTFYFSAGDTLILYASGRTDSQQIIINGEIVHTSSTNYSYTLPDADIEISLFGGGSSYVHITTAVFPSGTISITENGEQNVAGYGIADVNVSADDTVVNSILTRTISGTYSNSTITTIGSYAFAQCRSLASIDIPVTQYIEGYAFQSCNSLTHVYAPQVYNLGDYAFASCYYLSSVVLNFSHGINTINEGTFSNCYSLLSYTDLYTTQVYNKAFYCCIKLSKVCMPLLIGISTGAFMGCSSLESFNVLYGPKYIGSGAFSECYKLSTVFFAFSSQGFTSGSLMSSAFWRCYNLLSVYLYGSHICSLANVNVFSSTPISNYTTSTQGTYGSIFVPASLYASYITAANWSVYSSRIVSLTDAQMESVFSKIHSEIYGW